MQKIANFLRTCFWIVLGILALPYLLMTASAGTPVLVSQDAEVSTIPVLDFAKDPVYKGTVIEALDNPSSAEGKEYRLVRSFTSQGLCPSSAIIDLTETSNNDAFANHIVILDSEKATVSDDTENYDDKIVDTCKDLLSFSKDNPFSGIYLKVSPKSDWLFYADYFENLHVPYGYIVQVSEYESLKDSSENFATKVSSDNVYEEYNILPLVFDVTNVYVSTHSINSLYDSFEDVIIKDDESTIESDRECWTDTNEFASSMEFAKSLTINKTKNSDLEYYELNTESLHAAEFASNCSTLMEK